MADDNRTTVDLGWKQVTGDVSKRDMFGEPKQIIDPNTGRTYDRSWDGTFKPTTYGSSFDTSSNTDKK